MRPRVHVAYVGGTIGMRPTPDGFAPAPGYFGGLVERVLEQAGTQLPRVDFSEYEPLIDSSNATPDTWRTIARELYVRRDEFDGFVVLHGTDTMAYTASALSFVLPDFGKPIVVTGAQVPLEAARSDGRHNLIASLQIASDGSVPEVGLLFGRRLLRGNRATKVDASGLDAFDSPNLAPLATIGVEVDVNHTQIRSPRGPARLLDCGHSHVAAVRLFPGIDGAVLKNLCRPPLQGLVIEAYGAGNGPADDPAFLEAIHHASERGVVVVVVTQCLRGSVHPGAYATGSALLAAGAIPGYDMTTEAALTKLEVLLGEGLPAEEVRTLMVLDLAGELTEPRTR